MMPLVVVQMTLWPVCCITWYIFCFLSYEHVYPEAVRLLCILPLRYVCNIWLVIEQGAGKHRITPCALLFYLQTMSSPSHIRARLSKKHGELTEGIVPEVLLSQLIENGVSAENHRHCWWRKVQRVDTEKINETERKETYHYLKGWRWHVYRPITPYGPLRHSIIPRIVVYHVQM